MRGVKVLIVDDESINTKIISSALKRDGFDCTSLSDGSEVVDLVVTKNMRFDIILMDSMMRIMDGPDAVAFVRQHEWNSQQLHQVALFHSLSLSPSLPLSLPFSPFLSLSPSLSPFLSLCLSLLSSLPFCLSVCLSLSLSLSLYIYIYPICFHFLPPPSIPFSISFLSLARSIPHSLSLFFF